MECKVPDCDRLSRSRGWCDSHYRYWRRTGRDPSGPVDTSMAKRPKDRPERQIAATIADERLTISEATERFGLTREQVRWIAQKHGVVLADVRAERWREAADDRMAARIDAAQPCPMCDEPCLIGAGVCSAQCAQNRMALAVFMAEQGRTYDQIGNRLGLDFRYAGLLLRRAGFGRYERIDQAEMDRICALYRDRGSIHAVARIVGRSDPSTRRVLVRAGLIERRYPCGTLSAYMADGCLCERCLEANRAAAAAYRESKRAALAASRT